MHPSTARRERLVSPLNLALMAGLFAAAFFLLKPDADLAGTDVTDASEVDQLQLAYLKAQNHAGKSSDADVLKVVRDLVAGGRVGQARDLMQDYPALAVEDTLRFEIDMELAAQGSDVDLLDALDTLVKTPRWHREPLLERAVALSKSLQHPQTSMALYEAWAGALQRSDADVPDVRDSKAVAVYRQCGKHMVAVARKALAIDCYQKALDTLPATASAVDVQLEQLPLLAAASDEQQALLRSLMENSDISASQLERMAPVMLAVQRPDLAYRLYARLALNNPSSSSQWLPEAARWAQAAGKPVDAAVFLESLARQPDSLDDTTALNDQVEQLLLQAGKGRSALKRVSRRIDNNPRDIALLERGVNLARQTGEPEKALAWNTRLLSLEPDHQDARMLQSELALAVGDLPTALAWAEQRVQADASDVDAREDLAQVSEWSGNPQQALEHWQWLSQSGHGYDRKARLNALRQVVRLSQLTLEPGVGAKALRELTLLQPASEQDILQLVTLYELDGQPELASVAMRDIMALQGRTAFTLRTLAAHEYSYIEYAASLDAWNQFVDEYGHTVEASLARTELYWRLDRQDDAMQAASNLKGQTLLTQASDYQLRVMAEIAWRYRLPWLTLLVQPRIDALDVEDQRTLHGRRSLAVLQDAGDDETAMRESIKLWGNTGEADFALLAMQLAVKVDDQPVISRFSPEQRKAQTLHTSPAYWAQVASIRLRAGDMSAARQAYERALKLDSEHVESAAGLIWLAVGEQDEALLQTSLKQYAGIAERTPDLWQAMAIGYLQLGAASTSLVWFERLLDQIEADYGMLLTYADALEYAGRASDARKVRQYALQQLRPLLVEGSEDEQSLLLRQYARLSTRYEGIESNQALVDYLLDPQARGAGADRNTSESSTDDLWREDLAISWLMSTQQYEHARLIMAQIHAKRLQAPAWQQLALALKNEDKAALASVVNTTGPLSVGNHILALRQLGNDRKAYAMAQQALMPGVWLPGSGTGDRQIAQEQYISLRESRPSFVSGAVRNRNISGLNSTDTGVEIRHSFANSRLGLSLSAFNRQLDSDRYQLDGREEQTDLSLSVFFGGSRHYGKLTTGVNSDEQGDQSYASGSYAIRSSDGRREYSTELAYNEPANYSPELVIAGAQNRATVGLDASFGKREFVRLQADMTEINTRLEQRKVARGMGGSIELGMRGSFGSNSWLTSVTASQVQRDREAFLPEELRLSSASTMNSVLAENVQRLSIGASLSRGGVNADYPQVSSPRYYLNSSIGQNWPEQVVGFQIDAGAGIRVLGGDELSFSVSHDTQPITRNSDDATSVGMQYRYHFQ